jgi:photosystem II stability/assembly factor-like uncharacterized protein
MPTRQRPERFQVAFSFAGEQRDLVCAVAGAVEKKLGPSVFLDEWFQHCIAGDGADLRLQEIYQECVLAVVCVSGHYGAKPWTRTEYNAIRARQMESADSLGGFGVLPIRVGEGDVKGILFNTIAPDIRKMSVDEAAEFIISRLQLAQAELEKEGRQPKAEPTQIEKERRERAKIGPVGGIFSRLPLWARVVIVLGGILVVASSLYWASSRLGTADTVGSWKFQTSGTEQWLNSVVFVTPKLGWAVGGKGIFLHTEDGGGTWKQSQDALSHYVVPWSVVFATPYSGWAVGYAGFILHTEDGGGTWMRQNGGTTECLNSVAFPTPQAGWAVGEGGTILHTEDGGDSWKPQTSGTSEILHSVAFVTPKSGWAVGQRGIILHTGDGGRSWGLQNSGTPYNNFTSIAFVTPQSGWVVGSIILHTENGGASWKRQGSGTDELLSSVVFVTPKLGWAVGAKGTILHYQR